jgi:hypothetical protein
MLPTLRNYEEADLYQRGITNSVTRELVGLVFGTLTLKWLKGDRPVGDFDALFFVKTLEAALSSHEQIAAILRGETILWPDIENP